MKPIALALAAFLLATPLSPRQDRWQPGPEATEVALWPDAIEIAKPEVDGPETLYLIDRKLVAGKPYQAIVNVSRPTMSFYPAKGENRGATILVFPGGGYQALAIDLEGTEVCDWATARGINCAVLKYRVPQQWWHRGEGECQCEYPPTPFMPLQDAQRAMGLLRQRAAEWRIDPGRIGVLGFSAGGHLIAAISNADERAYDAVDDADKQSWRPDFAVGLYPGHLWNKKGVELYDWQKIRDDAPPTLLIQSADDPMDDVRHSLAYFLALREAKVPVELHIYPDGGHAFGLRPTDKPVTHWPELMKTWLGSIGMVTHDGPGEVQ